MQKWNRSVVLGVILALSLANVILGWFVSNLVLAAGGASGACYVLARTVVLRSGRRKRAAPAMPSDIDLLGSRACGKLVDPNDTDALVEQMLDQGRFALLLRPQLAGNLDQGHFQRAFHALEKAMALVPDGEVVLGQIDGALDDSRLDDEEIAAARGRVVRVQRFFLDRFPVTNRQYYEFVAAGGYEQMSLWEETMWPAVLDFVDRTGMPGPRYWRNGCFLPGEASHPVVGISWYEAGAYARWVGKRLPSDAEWVKAGTWPVPLSPTVRIQRKFPWGDTMDRRCANLWGSGPNGIAPVDQFTEGVSVGGIYQLIGNVWEWTSGNFRAMSSSSLSAGNPYPSSFDPNDFAEGRLVLPTPMKSIRGGAFDTYFDNQATCQFQSGESPLKRRHNIGLRCAIGVCDLALTRIASTGIEHVEPAAPEPSSLQAEEVPA